MSRYRVTFRTGPKVDHARFDELDGALDEIEARLRALGTVVQRETRDFMGREFAPVQQVAARAELRGPRGLRVGMDVRGDGSAEAWTGRLMRKVVERRDGEDAYSALRRVSCPS